MKRIYLYGIGGPESLYKVLRYRFIKSEEFSIKEVVKECLEMRFTNPSIERFFIIDGTYELYRDFREMLKHDSMEGNIEFKDILERDGLEIRL